MIVLGYVFLAMLVSGSIILIDYYLPGTFLYKFLDENFIETFATLIGFNLSAVIFVLGQLTSLEISNSKYDFSVVRKELKDNTYLLVLTFSISLVLLVVRPELNTDAGFHDNESFFILNGLILSNLVLAIVAIVEIIKSIFVLCSNGKSA